MGWIIACAVLLALFLLPLGCRVRYDGGGLTVRVIAGPVRFQVYPLRKKDAPEKVDQPEKTEKKEKKTANKDNTEAQKEEKQAPEPKTGGSLTKFLPLVRLALEALGELRRKIRLNNLTVHLTLACDDPCDLAVNYGRAWAAVGNLMPNLERLFVIKKRDIQIGCDFTASEIKIFAEGDVTITFGRVLSLALRYGVRALKEFFKLKQKGGAENE